MSISNLPVDFKGFAMKLDGAAQIAQEFVTIGHIAQSYALGSTLADFTKDNQCLLAVLHRAASLSEALIRISKIDQRDALTLPALSLAGSR